MLSYQHIRKYAAQAGFTLCGVARARVLTEYADRFAAGLAASGDGALGYLVRGPERRLDPAALLTGARSVVVCALRYDGRPLETPQGKVSAHRRGGDYHLRIKAMLGEVLERLRADVAGAAGAAGAAGVAGAAGLQGSAGVAGLRGKVCCDTSSILEKAWAVEAGLGWVGRNSLLVNPLYGSFLLLGELILDAECDRYDEPYAGVGCGECRRCVEACPTGALVPGPAGIATVDTRRCISALTIEKARGGDPVEALHGWIWGCDECQTVCPYQKNCRATKKNADFF